LNALKRYADSNEVFQLAKKAGSKDKSIDIWVNKNNRELAKGKEPIVQEVIVVPEEEKTSNIDAVPKELHYSTERIKSCIFFTNWQPKSLKRPIRKMKRHLPVKQLLLKVNLQQNQKATQLLQQHLYPLPPSHLHPLV